ncbi:cytochrome P450 [Blyttiomyces helicus]|uniref:Cytochrome P450 n=1 Tax=Blyttiomyces helicus TaxID=388810 RepID=A0A4P9W4B5_9FUNG|nr:cytochrome P450 [Blyttiomyces helicus]|eukprot:RKO86123.1 cytochrome P450 [Blyttiomyces helicus]
MISSALLAGYHTTALTIMWTMHALTRHPSAYETVREEIDSRLEGRPPTLADLDALPYLKKAINETFRLYTLAPFMSRELPTATHFPAPLSATLPKGTTVLIPASTLHTAASQWRGTDPDTFDMNREPPSDPLAFAPFGYGARACPAERFARAEVGLVVVRLLQRFEWTADDVGVVERVERFVVMAKGDIKVRVMPRAA